MTDLVSVHGLEHLLTQPAPGGIWRALARAADSPTMGVGDVWRGIDRRLLVGEAPSSTGLWQALAERVDPTRYCPRAVPDVAEEQVTEGDQTFTVIRSPRGHYVRLTATQREIWQQMDGTRTVAQLATYAFIQFHQLVPVGDVVATLKDEGFLMDRPVGMYRALSATLEATTAEGWGRRVLEWLRGKTWRVSNIDAIYTVLYRAGGWLFFTPIFLLLWALAVGAGIVMFVLALGRGAATDQVLELNGSVSLGLAILWGVLLVSFILHESAHAFAVKHYGRTLRGGGVMLYYGMPAAFVDTSDIWRSPRRARIVVSAAGPMSDLLVGGLASALAFYTPGTVLAAIAFKLAVTCYVATAFNANPLLELDGYFIMVDLMRLPDLRRRALAFVRGSLWSYLRHRTAFSHEERIFTWYGLLTVLYTIVAAIGAISFWNRQLVRPIFTLLAGSLIQKALGAMLLLIVVVPVLAGVLLAGWGVVRAGIGWIVRRGYGRQPALLAAALSICVIALTVVAHRAGTAMGLALAPLLWVLALGALLAVRPDYRGAAIAPTLNALVVTTAFAGLAALARAFMPELSVWVVADGLAFVSLVIASFAALLDVDLRLAPTRELLGTALLLMVAFGIGGIALFGAMRAWPTASAALQISAAAPAYFGAIALALLLPHLFGLHDSRLRWSWLLLWIATLTEMIAYVADIGRPNLPLDVLAAGLWAAAWLVHLATLRQITPDEITWPHEPSISEGQRLTRAFQFCYASCYQLLRAVYGVRRAKALDDRMDVLAATANWDVTLDRDRARINQTVLTLPLDRQGARYAEVLRYAIATIEEIAGASFARRSIRAAYDALPWQERETASRLCFPDTPWARELSNSFGDVRAGRLRLLRQVDMFLNCGDDELAALAYGLQEQTIAAGVTLLHTGAAAPGMWIVEAGEITAWQGTHDVRDFHRGDTFGAQELLSNQPAAHTYQTTVTSSILFIPAGEFAALTREQAPHAADGLTTAATLRLLERVPLFADLPRTTLRALVHIAQQQTFAAHHEIVRQGQPSGTFFIIKTGHAEVIARNDTTPQTDTSSRVVAHLGPEEFFGELELLRGTPPLASVIARTELTALALPHTAIQGLLMGDGSIARGLEQVGSGRILALREHISNP